LCIYAKAGTYIRLGLYVYMSCALRIYVFQGGNILLGGGPAGDESAGGAGGIDGAPDLEADVAAKGGEVGIGDDVELLVRGRVDVGGVAQTIDEEAAQAHGQSDGLTAYGMVECGGWLGVGGICKGLEQGLELNTHDAALGQQGSVALDAAEHVGWGVALGEDDGLATEGSALGAADIEDVGQAGEQRQRDIGAGSEAVGETGAVDIEEQVVGATDVVQGAQLVGGVEGAEFGGEGDVDHSGAHHVLCGLVGEIGGEPGAQLIGIELAFVGGQCDDLVAGELHGAGFVDIDVGGVCTEDALVGLQGAVDDGGVGLGASGEEPYLCLGGLAGLADELSCLVAEAVVAVALRALGIGVDEVAEHGLVGSVVVVALEVADLPCPTRALRLVCVLVHCLKYSL